MCDDSDCDELRTVQVRLLVLAVVGLLSACGEETDTDPRLLQGPLTVDSEFTREQRADIVAAVDLWQRATGARFAPELRFGEVSCGQPFAIEAVHTSGCEIGQEVGDGAGQSHAQRVLGAAHPHQHWVSVVTWLSGSDFRNNVAHELGHYLLVGHGEGIMAQAREHAPAVVAPSSINEFCAIWDCTADASKAAE